MNTTAQKVDKGIVNAMTVDVEDYFQVQAFFDTIERSSWDSIELRVERNVDAILEQFARHNTLATFFTLGWITERCPGMIKRIVSEGHEIASHGYDHTRADSQDQAEFREDVRRTKAVLEECSGKTVEGYRAATFSIGHQNMWAFDILGEEGYKYSSSINPINHDLYGMPDAPRFPFWPTESRSIIEIPVTTTQILGRNIPCGGGGYFRLLPYPLFRSFLRRVNASDRRPCMFYFHPWEIDATQPRTEGVSAKTRFRHYLNLDRMTKKLDALLRDFNWGRVGDAFQTEPKT